MPKTALAARLKRGGQSIEPDELTLITDRKDPLFDARVFNEITDAAILNVAAVGFVQPAAVRLRGKEAIVVDGQQRTKRGLVINHIVGRSLYRGDIPAVKAAIARLALASSDIGRRIIELCADGVKIPITVHRGAEKEAYAAKVSANEYREGDAIREKARKAQQLAKHGHDEGEIAAMFNVHVQTVKRWLARNVDKEPGVRKTRAKKIKPTAKRVGLVLARLEDWNGTERESALLNWVLGNKSLETLAKEFPEFAPPAPEAKR